MENLSKKIPKIISNRYKKISVYFIRNRHCKSNFHEQLNPLDCPKIHEISSLLKQTQEFIFVKINLIAIFSISHVDERIKRSILAVCS